jgi:hypothetical protein
MAQVWVHCVVNHGNGLVNKGMGESTVYMRRWVGCVQLGYEPRAAGKTS